MVDQRRFKQYRHVLQFPDHSPRIFSLTFHFGCTYNWVNQYATSTSYFWANNQKKLFSEIQRNPDIQVCSYNRKESERVRIGGRPSLVTNWRRSNRYLKLSLVKARLVLTPSDPKNHATQRRLTSLNVLCQFCFRAERDQVFSRVA
jgi:hypothetical protein